MAEADGTFAFHDVDPGAYTLTAYSGVARADQAIQVVPGLNDVRISFNRAEG
jgi:hypothetical protein